MNTKLNKSDWLILIIIFGLTIILNCVDYYRSNNALVEYVIDLPTSVFFSIFLILAIIKLVPKFLIENKKYISFFIISVLLLTAVGTLDKIIGRYTAGKTLEGISNFFVYMQSGLYNATDMIGFPLGILLLKKILRRTNSIFKNRKTTKRK